MAYNKEGSKENIMLRFYRNIGGELPKLNVSPSFNRSRSESKPIWVLWLIFALFRPIYAHFESFLGLFSAYLRHFKPNYGPF